jgi:hypothetical protein
MPVRTPEPRLPLEPEEYPLYRPPSRIGCSGLSIVALLSIFVFAILFWSVTPNIVQGITNLNPFASEDGTTTDTTPGAGALATETAQATAIATVGVITTPTPERHCVRVAGTGGEGTALRAEARTNAARIVPGTVGEGATLEIIGADVTAGKNQDGSDIVWKNVKLLPPDNRAGFMLARFVQDVPCP